MQHNVRGQFAASRCENYRFDEAGYNAQLANMNTVTKSARSSE